MANLKVLQLTGENNTTNIKVKGKAPTGQTNGKLLNNKKIKPKTK